MRLVADANVFFSAFIKTGLTRKLWFDARIELFAPRFIVEEFIAHASEITHKSGLNTDDSAVLFDLLIHKMKFVEESELLHYASAAKHLVCDEDDEAYVACALAANTDIWSHDRHLKQPRIRVWKTAELAKQLGYL